MTIYLKHLFCQCHLNMTVFLSSNSFSFLIMYYKIDIIFYWNFFTIEYSISKSQFQTSIETFSDNFPLFFFFEVVLYFLTY